MLYRYLYLYLVLNGFISLLNLLPETLNVCPEGGDDAIPLFHFGPEFLYLPLQHLYVFFQTANLQVRS